MVNGIRLFFYRLTSRKVNVKTIPVIKPSEHDMINVQKLRDERKHDESLKLFVKSSTGMIARDVAKLDGEEIKVLVERITNKIRESD